MLLAWRDRWRESVLAASGERRAEDAIVDRRALHEELDRVCADGYAHAITTAGATSRSVTVPVVDQGEAVGALQVSGVDVADDAAHLLQGSLAS